MPYLPLANRKEELGFFAGMVSGTTGERILLLEAGGGMGKTTLMAEFMRHCHSAGMPCVPVDLKGNPGLHEVLAKLCDGLGWEDFPSFAARVEESGREGRWAADLARFEHVHRAHYDVGAIIDLMKRGYTIDDLREFCFRRPAFEPVLDKFVQDAALQKLILGMIEICRQRPPLFDELLVALREERFELYRQYYASIYEVEAEAPPRRETGRAAGVDIGQAEIRDALWAADEVGRAARRGALTRALFEDLGAREGQLAILFDTCEQAGPELGAWLAETFLAHANRMTNMVVVVAGRQVPEMSLEWGVCSQHYRLGELRDPDLWQAYAEEIGAAPPSADWIVAFCDLFDGHPLQMTQALVRYMPGGGRR